MPILTTLLLKSVQRISQGQKPLDMTQLTCACPAVFAFPTNSPCIKIIRAGNQQHYFRINFSSCTSAAGDFRIAAFYRRVVARDQNVERKWPELAIAFMPATETSDVETLFAYIPFVTLTSIVDVATLPKFSVTLIPREEYSNNSMIWWLPQENTFSMRGVLGEKSLLLQRRLYEKQPGASCNDDNGYNELKVK